MKKYLLFVCVFFYSILNTNAQEWEALGLNDFDMASLSYDGYNNLVFDSSGSLYYGSNERFSAYIGESFITVRKLTGNKWINVGKRGFADKLEFTYLRMTIDKNDTLYVIYSDRTRANKAVVKKYDGSNWVDIGNPGFSEGTVFYTDISVNSSGVPYVCFYDTTASGTVSTVMKFDGNSWVEVGDSKFYYPTQVDDIFIQFDSSDIPYVAFSGPGYKPIVTKFNGTDWDSVGTQGFSDGQTDFLSFTISSSDELYVGYQDKANGNRATVKKFDGTDWVNVGNPGFSTYSAEYIDVAVNNNIPYVAFKDRNENGRVSVQKFNGTDWEYVGAPGFSLGDASDIEIDFDMNGVPFVVFSDERLFWKPVIKSFNGTDWVEVASTGFSKGRIDYLSLDIGSDNTPYAAFGDDGKIWAPSVVKRFDGSTWVNVGGENISGNNSSVNRMSISLDDDDIPYAAFYDSSSNKFFLKKFNGTTWENVPTGDLSISSGDDFKIIFDQNNNLIIFYEDYPAINVRKFNGNSWDALGDPISNYTMGEISYTISISGTLFVAFNAKNLSSGNDDRYIFVKKYNGTDWVDVGDPLFVNQLQGLKLFVASDDTPFVAFQEFILSDSKHYLFVKKYDGTQWKTVGSKVHEEESEFLYDLVLDAEDTPYVSFRLRYLDQRLKIRKYDGTAWVPVGDYGDEISAGVVRKSVLKFDDLGNLVALYGSPDAFAKKYATGVLSTDSYSFKENWEFTIYPNPVKDLFSFNAKDMNVLDIKVYDLTGKQVKWYRKEDQINLQGLKTGIYIIKLTTDKGSFSKKIIKQ